MARPTESIRAEHAGLLEMMATLENLVDSLSQPRNGVQNHELLGAHHWFVTALLPHAEVEEAHLYPLVDELMGGTGLATATMTADHTAIRAKVDALGDAVEKLAATASWHEAEIRRRRIAVSLAQLLAILRLHFEKEEHVYLNLLDENVTPERIEAALAHGHDKPDEPAQSVAAAS